jgi:hypothetical protein
VQKTYFLMTPLRSFPWLQSFTFFIAQNLRLIWWRRPLWISTLQWSSGIWYPHKGNQHVVVPLCQHAKNRPDARCASKKMFPFGMPNYVSSAHVWVHCLNACQCPLVRSVFSCACSGGMLNAVFCVQWLMLYPVSHAISSAPLCPAPHAVSSASCCVQCLMLCLLPHAVLRRSA